MRARLGIENWESLSAGFWPRQNDRQRDGCRVYFVARIGFRQRMRRGRFMLACSRATGLVSAASWLASLLNWRAGENARSRRETYRSCNQRGSHRGRSDDPAQHLICYTTIDIARRVRVAPRCGLRFLFAFPQAFCEEAKYDLSRNLEEIMKTEILESVAKKLVAPGKGILAADESSGTIEKRLKTINVPSTEENRRAYREILFTTAGAGEFISGVILFDETIRQKTRDGRTFVEALEQQGIIPGIKVDKGAKALPNFPGEKITEGLDGLRDRLAEYRQLGARFAKWRAVIAIGDQIPTRTCIATNAELLARYAALCQEADLVPIVEPEVLMDGAHTIDRHFEVTHQTLESVFHALSEHRVVLEGMLLKPNMVLSGKDCPQQATEHLNAMNRLSGLPWELSFSFGRALQAPVLKAWKGDSANVAEAQQAFHHRAWCNSKARFGKYTEDMETAKAAA